MNDTDLLAAIIAIVNTGDTQRPDDDDDTDDADSAFVDADFDAYQEIHRLLRLQGKLTRR